MQFLGRRPDGTWVTLCHHDKHTLYSAEWEEDCEPGCGPTFIVTAIGTLALAICKDLLFARHGAGALHQALFVAAAPILALCPAFSTSIHDVEHLTSSLLKELSCGLVFANACGNVQRFGASDTRGAGSQTDLRSFLAAPRHDFHLRPFGENRPTKAYGVSCLKAARDTSGADADLLIGSLAPRRPRELSYPVTGRS